MDLTAVNQEKQAQIMRELNHRSDVFLFRFLLTYSLFGMAIAFYYNTWLVAVTVAALALLSWFVLKLLLPGGSLHRYVASAFLGVFVATFIYQMHGLFEMHFFAFIGSAILIVYQDWKIQLPLILFVLIHHAVFAYLQYSGVPDVYFTQLSYMDLQTFIFHGSLAVALVGVCGYWAHHFRKLTIADALKSEELTLKIKQSKKLNKKLAEVSQVLKMKNNELEEHKRKLIDLTEKQAKMYERLRQGM